MVFAGSASPSADPVTLLGNSVELAMTISPKPQNGQLGSLDEGLSSQATPAALVPYG
jgi:hypothetical protein